MLAVTVIGGYLGAGKTTLVNHLLQEAATRETAMPERASAERIAVLVNDFGDLAIDAELVEARDDSVISLAGGCVCCSFGSDLVGALARLRKLAHPPQRAIIEASGVALPRAIARSVMLAPGVELDAVIVVADAQTVRERASDRFVGDTVTAQLRDADLVLLNKCDLGDARAASAWLAEVAPQANVIAVEHARVPFEVVVGPRFANSQRGTPLRRAFAAAAPSRGRAMRPVANTIGSAGELFEQVCVPLEGAVDLDALASALGQSALGIARAKGFVHDSAGTRWVVQVVGQRVDLHRWHGAATEVADAIVFVGVRGRISVELIGEAIRATIL